MFEYFIPVDVYNLEKKERINEPVKIDLHFDIFLPNEYGINLNDENDNQIPFQIFNTIKKNDKLVFASIYIICSFLPNQKKKSFKFLLSKESIKTNNLEGIKKCQTKLEDGFVNLDTGKYIIEL